MLQAPGGSHSEKEPSFATNVYDEFSCALLCSSSDECQYGLFEKDSKSCSLINAKPGLSQRRSDERESRKMLLEKVGNDISPYNSKLMNIF